jgi:hypothetical protein
MTDMDSRPGHLDSLLLDTWNLGPVLERKHGGTLIITGLLGRRRRRGGTSVSTHLLKLVGEQPRSRLFRLNFRSSRVRDSISTLHISEGGSEN